MLGRRGVPLDLELTDDWNIAEKANGFEVSDEVTVSSTGVA